MCTLGRSPDKFRSWLEARINIRFCKRTEQLAATATLCLSLFLSLPRVIIYLDFLPHHLLTQPISRSFQVPPTTTQEPASAFAPRLHSLPSDCLVSGVLRAVVVPHPLLSAPNCYFFFFCFQRFCASRIAQRDWHKGWNGGCSLNTFAKPSASWHAGGCRLEHEQNSVLRCYLQGKLQHSLVVKNPKQNHNKLFSKINILKSDLNCPLFAQQRGGVARWT